jgi:hypothetical protein
VRSRPRALLRLLQTNVSTSTTVDRSNTPTTESAVGATALVQPGLPGRGQPPNGLEVRGRGNRSSALPAAIARHGDFAPTSTVSGASCRGHPSLALSGVTWGGRDTAIASRACRARERQGRATPSFREEARRSPTRGTFHHEVVREGTKARAARQAERQCADAFFTDKNTRGGRPRGH